MKPRNPRAAASDYRAKTSHELSAVSREMKRAGHPAPKGDPLTGIMLLVEQPAGPRVLEALALSLDSVGLPDAYVTFSATGLLQRELLLCDPSLLVALGPEAASEIDALKHPLATRSFSDANEGPPFPWKRGCAGLLLPSLRPALDDPAEKRRFWKAFLSLKSLP